MKGKFSYIFVNKLTKSLFFMKFIKYYVYFSRRQKFIVFFIFHFYYYFTIYFSLRLYLYKFLKYLDKLFVLISVDVKAFEILQIYTNKLIELNEIVYVAAINTIMFVEYFYRETLITTQEKVSLT